MSRGSGRSSTSPLFLYAMGFLLSCPVSVPPVKALGPEPYSLPPSAHPATRKIADILLADGGRTSDKRFVYLGASVPVKLTVMGVEDQRTVVALIRLRFLRNTATSQECEGLLVSFLGAGAELRDCGFDGFGPTADPLPQSADSVDQTTGTADLGADSYRGSLAVSEGRLVQKPGETHELNGNNTQDGLVGRQLFDKIVDLVLDSLISNELDPSTTGCWLNGKRVPCEPPPR